MWPFSPAAATAGISSPDRHQAGSDGALRVTRCKALQRLGLLVRGKGGAPAALHATGFGLDPAGSGALGNTMTLVVGCDPQDGEDDISELRGGIHHRLRDRAEAGAGFFHCMKNVQQIARVTGKSIGRRHHQHVSRIERADRALELGSLSRRAAILLAINLRAAGRIELGELLS